MLTLRVKLEITAAILALVAVAIVGGSWLGAREEAIKLKATLDAQNAVISDAGKREAARDSALRDSLAAVEDLRKRTQTPQEAIRALPQVLPLPQPITLNLPAAVSNADPTRAGLKPDAPVPQTATIPAADLKPLFDFAATCKECQAKLAAATADKADDAVKIGALTKERDAAVTAAKGGSKWQRIKRSAKWFAVGAAIGAAAGAVARH
jgi:hypothetical protein